MCVAGLDTENESHCFDVIEADIAINFHAPRAQGVLPDFTY